MPVNSWSHDGQKARYYAKKRDYLRSKMSPSKRLRAEADADRLVDETIKIRDKKDRELERQQKDEGRDEAMNTAISELRKDGSIKTLTL